MTNHGAGIITDWKCEIIHLVTHSRLNTSYGKADETRPHVMVTLGTDSGWVGVGEASPLPMFTGETAESIVVQLSTYLLPALEGMNPLDIALCMSRLNEVLPVNSSAKAAIDIALHDLSGKITGQPVYRLLGGLRRPGGFPVTRAIGIESTDDAVSLARKWTGLGFRTLKLKVGTDPAVDIERIRAVAAAVPENVQIRIDANQGYDVADAIEVLGALREHIQYCEQPVAAWNLDGLRRIRKETGVRVLVDESVHSARDLLNVIRAEAADLVAIKLIKCGGLRGALRIAYLAETAGMPCVVVSPFESHVGAAAGVHLGLALPATPYAHELSIFHVEPEGQMTASAISTEEDWVLPPTESGLAVSYAGMPNENIAA